MTAKEITQYLAELNDELCALGVKGEICLYGGAVMCLVYKARPATKDVDAIFAPVKFIRRAAGIVAARHGLPTGWLNFAVKMFVVEHPRRIFCDLPNLQVYVPEADYLLAMKVLAARADTSDADDILFLVQELKLSSVAEVTEIVCNYYPRKQIKPEAVFLLEEIFERRQ
jgi:hypothetical protein